MTFDDLKQVLLLLFLVVSQHGVEVRYQRNITFSSIIDNFQLLHFLTTDAELFNAVPGVRLLLWEASLNLHCLKKLVRVS